MKISKKEHKTATNNSVGGYEMIFVIVSNGYGADIVTLLKDNGVRFVMQLNGDGTASTSLRHLLSLDEGKKDVILAITDSDKRAEIINTVCINHDHSGVAFAIKLGALGGRNLLNYLKGVENGKDI